MISHEMVLFNIVEDTTYINNKHKYHIHYFHAVQSVDFIVVTLTATTS